MNKRIEKNWKLKLFISVTLISIVLIFSSKYALASVKNGNLKVQDYSEEYKQWQNLANEEKTKTIMPQMYEVTNITTTSDYMKNINNLSKFVKMLGSSLETTYNLKDTIPDNMVVKNQSTTNDCWAFSTTGALETNLALQDVKNSKSVTKYDYSERHMVYSVTRSSFLNNAINSYGLSKTIATGGNFEVALNYLTNGMGAISESDMPFKEDESNINISEIQNKDVKTTVVDTVAFNTDASKKADTQLKIKEFIKSYGAVTAGIYMPTNLSGDYYNNNTAALYCDTKSDQTALNHQVMIVGWNDNFDKSNFNTKHQPTNNGAWIIRNSYGTEMKEDMAEAKKTAYNANTAAYNSRGITSADAVPDADIINVLKTIYGEGKVNTSNGVIYIEVGDKGYMYISYDDIYVLSGVNGIENASANKEYNKVYENDLLGADAVACDDAVTSKLYLANVFKRDNSATEQLTKISINTQQDYTLKVYVNPSSSDKSVANLQQAKLVAGDTETITAGYHTIEFAQPITLTGSEFAVVVEIEKTSGDIYFLEEHKTSNLWWDYAEVNAGESFYTYDSNITANKWFDLATDVDATAKGNACIRAYTTNAKLNLISVTKNPTKLTYEKGKDSLDLSGGEITLTYDDGTKKTVSMTDKAVKATGFDNTKEGEQTIAITYQEKTTTFKVTVTSTTNVDNTKKPVSSNFDALNGIITSAKGYVYKNKEGTDHCIYNIKISGIKIGDKDDTYTYSYYLSGKQGEKDITGWIKIDTNNVIKNDDGTITANIEVNTQDLPNRLELANEDNLYLYLKEDASINGTTISMTSATKSALTTSSEPTIYIDDVSEGTKTEVTDKIITIESSKTQGSTDTTTAKTSIPQTGENIIIGFGICVLVIAGIWLFARYKMLDKKK